MLNNITEDRPMTQSQKSKSKQLPYVRHKRWNTAYTYIRDEHGKRKQVAAGVLLHLGAQGGDHVLNAVHCA